MQTSRAKWCQVAVLGALLSMFGHTGVARAAQGDGQASSKEWYGTPILIGGGIGGAALGAEAILALQGKSISPGLWIPTAGVYLLTGPVVHLMHHETGRAFGSVAIDVATPAVVALFAATVLLFEPNCDHGLPHESGPSCSRAVPLAMIEMGFLTGPLIDGLVLARHVHPPATNERPPAFTWNPLLLPTAGELGSRGFTLGLSGAF
jgi:hypothetical protein